MVMLLAADNPDGIDLLDARLRDYAGPAVPEDRAGAGVGLSPLLIAAVIEAVILALRYCPQPTPAQLKQQVNKPLLRLQLRRQSEYMDLSLPTRGHLLDWVWAQGQRASDEELSSLIRAARGTP